MQRPFTWAIRDTLFVHSFQNLLNIESTLLRSKIDWFLIGYSRWDLFLEAVPDERGVTTYKRVGLIKPIKDKIWDNRFMADEEKTTEAALDGTLFEKISGKDFYPGMLIRETKWDEIIILLTT